MGLGLGEDLERIEGKREIRKTVRNLVKLGVDFIKMVSSGGFTDPFDTNPLELQFSREEQRILVEDAHRLERTALIIPLQKA
ncbi:hypothetical protein KEJ19_07455 [Candidatus Bathyarchaeota archaeon]|nr:hypothetical protein [Candidatus Bathyarchaeota archaeon]